MKITRRQLRRLIKESIIVEFKDTYKRYGPSEKQKKETGKALLKKLGKKLGKKLVFKVVGGPAGVLDTANDAKKIYDWANEQQAAYERKLDRMGRGGSGGMIRKTPDELEAERILIAFDTLFKDEKINVRYDFKNPLKDVDFDRLFDSDIDAEEEEESANQHEIHFVRTFLADQKQVEPTLTIYFGFKTKKMMYTWAENVKARNLDFDFKNGLVVFDDEFMSEETKLKIKAFTRCKPHDAIEVYEYDGKREMFDLSKKFGSGYIMHIFFPERLIKKHDTINC